MKDNGIPWVVVTGATGSMGRVAVEAMAREGRPVILACRNLERGAEVMEAVRMSVPDSQLRLESLDLSSQASVRSFAAALEGVRIGALFNNAGTMMRHYKETEDGLEQTLAVNFVNLALLTSLLIPMMESGARIVNMVSLSIKFARMDADWMNRGKDRFSQLGNYSLSKLLLLYYSVALSRRYPQFHVNVADPGIVDSAIIRMDRWFDPLADLVFRPLINSPEKGARPAIAALHSDESMMYYVGRKHSRIASKYTQNPLVGTVWEEVESILPVR